MKNKVLVKGWILQQVATLQQVYPVCLRNQKGQYFHFWNISIVPCSGPTWTRSGPVRWWSAGTSGTPGWTRAATKPARRAPLHLLWTPVTRFPVWNTTRSDLSCPYNVLCYKVTWEKSVTKWFCVYLSLYEALVLICDNTYPETGYSLTVYYSQA